MKNFPDDGHSQAGGDARSPTFSDAFRSPDHYVSLFALRKAFQSRRMVSALLGGTAFFFVVVLASSLLNIQKLHDMYSQQHPGYATTLVSSVNIILLVLVLLTIFFDVLLNAANRFTILLGFILYVFCVLLWNNASEAFFTSLSEQGGGSAAVTFTLSFSILFGFSFGSVSLWTLFLKTDDRIIVARHLSSASFLNKLLTSLPYFRGHKLSFMKRITVSAIFLISTSLNGVAIILGGFLIGSTVAFAVIETSHISAVGVFNFNYLPDDLSEWADVWNLTVPLLIIFILFIGVSTLSITIKKFARYAARSSYDKLAHHDRRAAILFLRHFGDDQVTLPKLPLLEKLWRSEPGPRRLDHELVERFSILGPIVALGRPGEVDLPFGAARTYLPTSNWQPRVIELAHSAAALVVVVDNSKGIEWEIRTSLQEALIEKTLYLANPQKRDQDLLDHPILGPILREQFEPVRDRLVVGAFRNKGKWTLLLTNQMHGDDFILCCYAFFRNGIFG